MELTRMEVVNLEWVLRKYVIDNIGGALGVDIKHILLNMQEELSKTGRINQNGSK